MRVKPTRASFSRELCAMWDGRIIHLRENCFFPHVNYQRALDEFCAIAYTFTRGEVALLSGPTGSGKTTLLEDFVRGEVGLKPEEPIEKAKSLDPRVVYVEARKAHHRPYRPRLLYVDTLEFLGDFLAEQRFVAQKLDYRRRDYSGGISRSKVNDSQDVLLFLVERALRNRAARQWLIDEAQEMFKGNDDEVVEEVLGLAKSISNRNPILPAMAGTYELAAAFDHNAQWNRRATIVHLPRYHSEIEIELQEWVNIMESYRVALGVSMDFNILDYAEMIIAGTAGITGELSDWLVRSMRLALASKKEVVSLENFRKAGHNPVQIRRLMREVTDGERRIQGLLDAQRRRKKKGAGKRRKYSTKRKSRRYKVGGLG